MNQRYRSMQRMVVILVAASGLATAAQAAEYVVTIQNQQFTPKELTVPAGEKFKLVVKNADTTPAEFESSDLNREKVIGAKSEAVVFLGPLDAGSYQFFDEFHPSNTGVIVAK